MSLDNITHNAAVLLFLLALAGLTVVSALVLVSSVSDGDTSTAWFGAAVFLLVSLIDVWVFWRMLL